MSEHRNPIAAREIPYQIAGQVALAFGWDRIVIIAEKDGDSGGKCITSAGTDFRNARIAQDQADFLRREVLGMKLETDALDSEIAAAEDEMREGPKGGDPDTGKRIIMPAIERKKEIDG